LPHLCPQAAFFEIPAACGVSNIVPLPEKPGLCLRSVENFLCDDKFFASII